MLGTVSPQKVADAVLKTIRRGHTETLVAPTPMRPLFVLGQISPRLRLAVPRRLGLIDAMRREAENVSSVGEQRRQAATAQTDTAPIESARPRDE
jgi:hypothetical protein